MTASTYTPVMRSAVHQTCHQRGRWSVQGGMNFGVPPSSSCIAPRYISGTYGTPFENRMPPVQPIGWLLSDVTLIWETQQFALNPFRLQDLEDRDTLCDGRAIIQLVGNHKSRRSPILNVIDRIVSLISGAVLVHRPAEMVFEVYQIHALHDLVSKET